MTTNEVYHNYVRLSIPFTSGQVNMCFKSAPNTRVVVFQELFTILYQQVAWSLTTWTIWKFSTYQSTILIDMKHTFKLVMESVVMFFYITNINVLRSCP